MLTQEKLAQPLTNPKHETKRAKVPIPNPQIDSFPAS